MKTLPTLALAVLAAVSLRAAEEKPLPKDLPPFGQDKALPVPAIDQSMLPNGLTVWIVRRTGFPRTTALLAVRGGTAADPAGREGIAELLADTLKEGTATRSAKRIAEELQGVGGEIAASAAPDAIFVTVDGLASGTDTIVAVLGDLARAASFPAAEVELAKANALQGLEAREATPEFPGEKAFAQALYGSHPYHVIAPSRETLQAATRAQLKEEFARRFRPEGSLLVIAGEVDPVAVKAMVGRAFGGWKVEGPALTPTPAPGPSPGRKLVVVSRKDSVQSLFIVGRLVPTVTEPDYFPLLVANTLYAGAFGSRLVQNIREDKGYTYSPQGRLQAFQRTGVLRVRADVRTDVTAGTLLEIDYELDRLGATNPGAEELARAKRYQTGLYLLRNQAQGAVARTLANNWVNGLPPEALGQFVTRVNGVSAADVRRVGKTYFPSSTQAVVVVGDEARIKEELSSFPTLRTAQP
jgi:predicted Zn-dependent peptidase